MNSYTAVRATGQKVTGRITTAHTDSITGALVRLVDLLARPGRFGVYDHWMGQGCPVIENNAEEQVFYLCYGEED